MYGGISKLYIAVTNDSRFSLMNSTYVVFLGFAGKTPKCTVISKKCGIEKVIVHIYYVYFSL